MKTSRCSTWIGAALAGLLFAGAFGCGGATSDLEFFRGKTVTIIVPYGVGGGMDVYARALAPFLQKYLPGSKVDVKNVTEGGGLAGKNQIYAAPPDGLTLGITPISGALLAEWEGKPGVQYKVVDYTYLGRLAADAHVMVVSPKSGFATLADIVRAQKVRMGFTGVGSDDYYVALITAELLGFQVEPRTDFLSANDAGLACVKGEVDALLFADSNLHAQIEAHTLTPVVTFSVARLATLPAVPAIFEVIPADQQALMLALVQIYALDRAVIAPPHLPAGRVQVLRQALDQAVADPEYLQTMKTLNRPVDYLNGADTVKLLEGILSNAAQIEPLVLKVAQGSR